MGWFSFAIFFSYLFLIMFIIPKSVFEFDLVKIRFRLLPNRFRILSVLIFVVTIITFIAINGKEQTADFLIAGIDLALFILLFSKQKNEDEFSEQVRIKSFTYSFVSFVGLLGAFSALEINTTESNFTLDSFLLNVLVGASLLMALIYFNVTLYKTKKK
jgi:peptidoglycan/LPS O-acetylase OafA/YrhL